MMNVYPRLLVRPGSIRKNAEVLTRRCKEQGIEVAGVVKFCGSDPGVAASYLQGGCTQLATARVRQLRVLREAFPEAILMMLRLPMHSEVQEVVKYSDISLNSEESTLWLLNEAARQNGRKHEVLLMYDVGDLREGLYSADALLRLAARIEKEMKHLYLKGIGTSFACFGGVLPNPENLARFSQTAQKVEEHIGRSLETVSGGSSISLPSLFKGEIPRKINHLRLGGVVANPRGMRLRRGVSIPGLCEETFVLEAQLIEVQEKPSAGVALRSTNWRGEAVCFEDKGMRRRAIAALGAQDVLDPRQLTPLLEGVEIIGSSSDHTLLDVTECRQPLKVGDILRFSLMYENLLFAFQSSDIPKYYEDE